MEQGTSSLDVLHLNWNIKLISTFKFLLDCEHYFMYFLLIFKVKYGLKKIFGLRLNAGQSGH